jgi:transposase
MAGVTGRRYWSLEEKRAIVAESFEVGMSIAGVARRHDMNANLISTWRRDPRFKTDLAEGALPEAEPVFLPVEIGTEAFAPIAMGSRTDATLPATDPPASPSPIEIALVCGTRLRVESHVEEAALTRVIRAIGAAA